MENLPLFEVRVNSQGAEYIRKFARVANVIFFVTFLLNLVVIYSQVRYLVVLNSFEDAGELYFREIVSAILTLVATLINFILVYYYVRFARQLNASLKEVNEVGFNHAFKLIYINCVIYLVLIFVDLLNWILFLPTFEIL